MLFKKKKKELQRLPPTISPPSHWKKKKNPKTNKEEKKNTVKLQGISGQQEGTEAKNLKTGDVIVWNYGMKSEVVEINPSKTGKTIIFMLRSYHDGKTRSRKMRAGTLVVVDKNKKKEPEKTIKKSVNHNLKHQTTDKGAERELKAEETKAKEKSLRS